MTTERVTAAFATVLVLWGSEASASPADLFGIGLRSQGMAQTGVAEGNHDHQSYLNPALLGGRSEQHLTLGYQSALFRTRHSAATEETSQELASGTLLGVTLPLPLGGVLEKRFAIGFSAYSPRRLVTRARLWFPERPQFPLLANRAQSLSLSTGLGVQLHERLRVGVGLRWLASLVGSVVVAGNDDDQTTTVVRDQLVTSTAPVVGVGVTPIDDWHVGLVWRDVHLSAVDVQIRLDEVGSLVLPELNVAGIAQYNPEQVDGELALTPGPWHLALALRYRRWSSFPGFLGKTVHCPAAGPCGTADPAEPGFRDTWSPRLGLAHRTELSRGASSEVRLGLAYEPTPMPEQSQGSNTWDNSRIVVCVGYGLEWLLASVPLNLGIALQQHWLSERSHEKRSEFAEAQPDLARVTTAGQVSMVGLAAGTRF